MVWLNVEGADEPGELTIGTDVKFVIGYGNFGNRRARGVTLSLSLAEGLATIAGPDTDIDPRDNVAYAKLRAPRSASRIASPAGAVGGGNVLWYGLLAVLAAALIGTGAWAAWRAKRRDKALP